MDTLPIIIIVCAPFLFVGVWCFVCWIISQVGGWAALAKKFPADGLPSGETLHGESLQLNGFCNYNSVMKMTLSEHGLHLAVMPIFVGHKPVMIPWSEIHRAVPRNFLWIKQVGFEIGDPKAATMRVLRKTYLRFPLPEI
ncbi:MAG: hypothetical protein NWT08_01145 [Akkermansiaceae bacterium]|jgi:hypothetical protein|nr:hypothetical protein [Akkermansiaceae bacterium]MDP4645685.1 hypothetical protein [Akkermansiaceae bacterium]MDP4721621.1 hypothetical protein [Akkermansiaceae bacterium]MDP4778793.1 hypothetical protein [Akkermansiaceae bacterium]MDP4847005.1 hypothetical protein [Akkermansiaceae bacterium]